MMWRLVLPGLLCCATVISAQTRDGAMHEQRSEEAAAECRIDPACIQAVRAEEVRMQKIQDAYEEKSPGEKIAGWVLGLALLAGLIGIYVVALSAFGGSKK